MIVKKICPICGDEFVRRKGEQKAAFERRKKCSQGCIGFTMSKTKVLGFHANSAEGIGDCGVSECHMFTSAWFSQHSHWIKFY